MCVSIFEVDKPLYFYNGEIEVGQASRIMPVIEEAFQNVSFSVKVKFL